MTTRWNHRLATEATGQTQPEATVGYILNAGFSGVLVNQGPVVVLHPRQILAMTARSACRLPPDSEKLGTRHHRRPE